MLGGLGFGLFVGGLVLSVILVIVGIALAVTGNSWGNLVSFAPAVVSPAYGVLIGASLLGTLSMMGSGIVMAIRAKKGAWKSAGFIILGIIFLCSSVYAIVVIGIAVLSLIIFLWAVFSDWF